MCAMHSVFIHLYAFIVGDQEQWNGIWRYDVSGIGYARVCVCVSEHGMSLKFSA